MTKGSVTAHKRNDARTADAILDVAERLAQTRGFNAFSYADVAAELGITKPALHYHFAGKGELGSALLERYTGRFNAALEAIDASGVSAARKLEAYADLYAQVLAQDRMCLCGMLAADYHTLPEPMRNRIVAFFDNNQAWLTRIIDEGRSHRTLRISGDSADAAQMVIGTLEGAMLVARTYRDPDRFTAAARQLLAKMTAPTRKT